MKILVTGATGLIGSMLCRKLCQEGHEVRILSRRKDPSFHGLPVRAFQWKNPQDRPPREAFEELDSVINLMGEPILGGIYTKAKEKAIWDSRVLATQQIAKALKDAGSNLKSYVGASAIGYYPFTSSTQREGMPAGDHNLARLCQAWEAAHKQVNQCEHQSIVRIGLVLSAMSPMFQATIRSGLWHTLPQFGSGDQYQSWIHIDDLTNLFLEACHGRIEGEINGVAGATTSRELNEQMGSYFRGPMIKIPVPSFILKAVAGPPADVLVKGQRIESTALTKSKFKLRYTDANLDAALKNCLNLSKNPRTGVLEPCFRFEAFQYLPKDTEVVWPFFSDPYNLEKITPKMLKFHITNINTKEIQAESLIEYKLRLRGIPIRWKTLIESYDPNKSFVDTQLKGPYRIWHHTHTFESCGQGTLMTDRVNYQLPLLPFGMVALPIIAKDIKEIFNYRQTVIKDIFKVA
ncbi:DUF1731 domain-containing protein [Pseudobacteriovorax antillogorgiicola]|uniref:Uncharacterized protein n=1 Tax=Pseudobacteriovorax antillogorgiicola TaxID=1513793 RepID=A0A1Y6BDW8_9BACT|nr:DUF1731 domain-containing protein [Pseudobacteriovorax antillogorgiicola]TCS57578.1 hypothetical protein EDD56_103318 [Pseudobacteriovorax antillogorgiicola]SME99626.1 hypothetical protein SAMN06296036_10315 [Pseudobacteriovorax antillogorgiicola]